MCACTATLALLKCDACSVCRPYCRVPSAGRLPLLITREFSRTYTVKDILIPPLFISRPLGPLGFNSPNTAQRHALHVERTAEEAVMLSDRV